MKPARSGEAGGERGMQSHRPERIVFESKGFFAMRLALCAMPLISPTPILLLPLDKTCRRAQVESLWIYHQGEGIVVFSDEQYLLFTTLKGRP
jgi:hypothetical protein